MSSEYTSEDVSILSNAIRDLKQRIEDDLPNESFNWKLVVNPDYEGIAFCLLSDNSPTMNDSVSHIIDNYVEEEPIPIGNDEYEYYNIGTYFEDGPTINILYKEDTNGGWIIPFEDSVINLAKEIAANLAVSFEDQTE